MNLTPFPVALKNGTCVLIREVTPDDRHLLQMGFAHLSDRSKYFRFLAARHNLTAAELDDFTAFNGPDHVAIGALINSADTPEPVGIGRYIRLPDQTHIAEIAITIVDEHQRQGLGSVLLGVLAKFASLNGITEFSALVHGNNRPMQGLLNQIGGKQDTPAGPEIDFHIPLPGHSGELSATSVSCILKDAYPLAQIT
jgi:RimJ/RimL family protein N-acetyltransferase